MDVVLSLGSNLGDRRDTMRRMELYIATILDSVYAKSPLYETEAVGVDSHPNYLNRVVFGSYTGTAEQLLDETEAIERALGRTDKGKLQPRTADIDILLFGDQILSTERLTIPHHALFERRFEIQGVCETAPLMRVPGKEIPFSQYAIPEEVMKQVMSVVREDS